MPKELWLYSTHLSQRAYRSGRIQRDQGRYDANRLSKFTKQVTLTDQCRRRQRMLTIQGERWSRRRNRQGCPKTEGNMFNSNWLCGLFKGKILLEKKTKSSFPENLLFRQCYLLLRAILQHFLLICSQWASARRKKKTMLTRSKASNPKQINTKLLFKILCKHRMFYNKDN